MSEQNVELARRALEAYNAHDVEAFLAVFDPGIEFHSAFEAVGGGVYRGHDGMRRFFEELVDAWGEDGLHLESEAYFDLGEHTLAFYVAHGRGRGAARRSRCRLPWWRGGGTAFACIPRATLTERTRSGTWASQRTR